jgi:serine/threonine-protein kinase
VPAARPPLEALAGGWVGNGRELEAVYLGGALEFRVKDPEQFRPQDYQQGEARFILRPLDGQTAVFAVEDHIRPNPPGERAFAASSRGTCQEVWTDAGGKPLRATWDGKQLSVEFAKIEPKDSNFVVKKGEIVNCLGLRKLSAAKVVSSLTRQ